MERYIEEHKSKTGTLASYYMPAFFMSNFSGMGMINPGPDGTLTFAVPFSPSAIIPMIDINKDTGAWVWGAIEAGSAADGVQIQAAGDWITGQEIVDIFTKYGGAGEVKFWEAPRDTYKSWLVPKMGDYIAEEFTQNMDLIGEFSYYGKGTESKQQAADKLLYNGQHKTSFKEYVEQNKPFKF